MIAMARIRTGSRSDIYCKLLHERNENIMLFQRRRCGWNALFENNGGRVFVLAAIDEQFVKFTYFFPSVFPDIVLYFFVIIFFFSYLTSVVRPIATLFLKNMRSGRFHCRRWDRQALVGVMRENKRRTKKTIYRNPRKVYKNKRP